jgi:GNAT superfamily N-acetyltransferase
VVARPADAERWDDLLEVFRPRGAYDGCWCMYWRIKRSEMGRLKTAGRRAALHELTTRPRPPGLLYYEVSGGGTPVPFGWCALGPREDFSVLQRSPVLKPVDELPTWSMVCFFLREPYRGRGLFRRLAALALDYARAQQAPRIEVYPRENHITGPYAYQGITSVYLSLGFREIARRKPLRPILRLEL